MRWPPDDRTKLVELRVCLQMLESATDADRSAVQRYATQALQLMTDLLSALSPDNTWGSEQGAPWPEVTPMGELVAAARWALQHWDGEPAQAIVVRRRQGCPPAAYRRELPHPQDGPQERFNPQRAYHTDLAGSPVLDLLQEVYPLLVHRLDRVHADHRPRTHK